MDQVVIFKQIFDKVRNDLNYQWFYSELKRHNVSHYIYYLATENVHIVLKNDNTVLLKGLKNIVSVKFSKDRHLIETTSNKLRNTEETLLKQEFFGGLQISTNKKDITIPLIIHYSLLKTYRAHHKCFHTKP